MEETLQRQKFFLKEAIGEARKKEYARIKKLQNSKSKAERDSLCARFENERIIDQNKISHLSQELDVIKTKSTNGDLSNLNIFRDTIPKHLRAMDKHHPNRFAGIEDYEGIVFHGAIIEKFDRHDKIFEARKNFVPFDSYKENKKLELLSNKKALLTKLIDVHGAEMRAAGQYVPPAMTQRSNSCGRSTISASTGESWATFASNRAPPSRHNSASARHRVPQLQLGGLS